MTDNGIVIIYQTEYWMPFIYNGALALYSVAMIANTHTHKKMKDSAAICAVLTRFLRSSMSSPQNQGLPAAVYRSLNSEIKAMVDRTGSSALRRYARLTKRTTTPLRVEWLLVVALLASGSAAAIGSTLQSHPSVGPASLVGWAHGTIYSGTL